MRQRDSPQHLSVLSSTDREFEARLDSVQSAAPLLGRAQQRASQIACVATASIAPQKRMPSALVGKDEMRASIRAGISRGTCLKCVVFAPSAPTCVRHRASNSHRFSAWQDLDRSS